MTEFYANVDCTMLGVSAPTTRGIILENLLDHHVVSSKKNEIRQSSLLSFLLKHITLTLYYGEHFSSNFHAVSNPIHITGCSLGRPNCINCPGIHLFHLLWVDPIFNIFIFFESNFLNFPWFVHKPLNFFRFIHC